MTLTRKIRAAATASLAVCAMSLSGCAQIMNFGDLLWTETKQASVSFGHKVGDTFGLTTAKLRGRAQVSEPVFTQSAEVTYIPEDGITLFDVPQAPAQLLARAPIATPEASPEASLVAAFSDQPETRAPSFAGYDQNALAQGPYSEADMPDLSYVKLSGSTSITDWQNCQAAAGSYITPRGNGFVVNADFDYCMRVKGYIAEREAIAMMESITAP